MNLRLLFGLSILGGFVASGLVAGIYIWPHLRMRERRDALLPLVIFHTFRFVGLSFLVPGYAYYQGIRMEVDPGLLGAAFFIPTALVPALLTAHFLIFRILARPER